MNLLQRKKRKAVRSPIMCIALIKQFQGRHSKNIMVASLKRQFNRLHL
jgi:hypothetical protein